LIFPDRLAPSESHGTLSPILADNLGKSLSALPPPLLDLYNALPDYAEPASANPEAAFQLHALLSALDPPVAARWHWKDTRKVLRSLRIMKDTGRKPSEMITEQSESLAKPRFAVYLIVHIQLTGLVADIARFAFGFTPDLQFYTHDWMLV
jgi:tRNA dimethylallyltransferase